jgi:hypothetical protein
MIGALLPPPQRFTLYYDNLRETKLLRNFASWQDMLSLLPV